MTERDDEYEYEEDGDDDAYEYEEYEDDESEEDEPAPMSARSPGFVVDTDSEDDDLELEHMRLRMRLRRNLTWTGALLTASFVLPWALLPKNMRSRESELIFAWDFLKEMEGSTAFAYFLPVAGVALFVLARLTSVAAEMRAIIAGGVGVAGLLTLLLVGDSSNEIVANSQRFMGAGLFDSIIWLAILGLVAGLQLRANYPRYMLGRIIIGVCAGIVLLAFLFPQELPDLESISGFGEVAMESQVPLLFLFKLFLKAFDLTGPAVFTMVVMVILVMVWPVCAGISLIGVAKPKDEEFEEDEPKIKGLLQGLRMTLCFSFLPQFWILFVSLLGTPFKLFFFLYWGFAICAYMLLSSEGISVLLARILKARSGGGGGEEKKAAASA